MRLPSPVLIKPLAKKKASAISHGIGSPKAEKAAAKVRVLVSTDAPRPRSATAPSGSGCVMMPTMVARKIASSCHAFLETPAGCGTNHRMTPVAIAAASGFSAAPCHGGLGLEVTAVEEEARTTVVSFLATRLVCEIGEGTRRGLVVVVNKLCWNCLPPLDVDLDLRKEMDGGDWPREKGRNPRWQEEESGREAMDSEGDGRETERISTGVEEGSGPFDLDRSVEERRWEKSQYLIEWCGKLCEFRRQPCGHRRGRWTLLCAERRKYANVRQRMSVGPPLGVAASWRCFSAESETGRCDWRGSR